MRSVLALCSVLVLQSLTNHWLRTHDTAWVQLPTQAVDLASPEKVKAFSFGHWPSVVDWLWIKVLQDTSLRHVEKGERASIAPALHLATQLDPANFDAYYYGSLLLSIVRSDGENARLLLERGELFRTQQLPSYPAWFQEQNWGRAFQIPLVLGYVYLYELEDLPRAAEAYRAASLYPDAPAYLKNLGARLKTVEGQYESAIKYLSGMANSEKDPEMKRKLTAKRDALYVGLYLHELNQSFRVFLNKIPSYRNRVIDQIPASDLEKYWKLFQRKFKVAVKDPLGGKLTLDRSGRIVSTSRRERTFGLE